MINLSNLFRKGLISKFILFIVLAINSILLSAQVNPNFTFSKSCDGTVTFTPQNQGYDNYEWDFGNGTKSSLVKPSVNYSANAVKKYSVTLTVTHKGNSFKKTEELQINPKATAKVIFKKDICPGETIKYLVTDPKSHFKYIWTCEKAELKGDINSGEVSIQWHSVGTYSLRLKVSDNNACDTLLIMDIEVHALPKPNLSLRSSDSMQNKTMVEAICKDNTKEITILPLPGIPLNPKSSYLWTSTCAISKSAPTKETVVFQFPNIGKCLIKLIETNEFGCIGVAEKTMTVLEKPDIKLLLADGCLGSVNSFYASAHPRSLAYYEWDFGDGSSSRLKNPEHKYSLPGKYTINFFGTDESGCIDTVKKEISIDNFPGPPIVCIGTICSNDEAVYSTPAIQGVSYNWKVSGGTIISNGTKTDNNIKIKWGKDPFGEIELSITGTGQYCKNPTIQKINLLGETYPIAGKIKACIREDLIYSTDLINGATYEWSIPSNAYIFEGESPNQIHVSFYKEGKQKISVKIKHAILDCISTGEIEVDIKPVFDVSGTVSPCFDEPASYYAYPTTGKYQWDADINGTLISGQNTNTAKIKWTAAGTFPLKITNATDFCNSEYTLNINVIKLPGTFINGAKTACRGIEENYTLSGNAKIVKWMLPSGVTAINGFLNNSLQVKWTSPGIYKILAIYGAVNYNCIDTVELSVTVTDNTMPEILGDSIICFNDFEKYTIKGTINDALVWQITGGDYNIAPDKKSLGVKWNNGKTGSIKLINPVCYAEVEKLITINPQPNPTITLENFNCDGTTADIKVTEEFKKYTWNTGKNTQAITVKSPGTYSVDVESTWGCTGNAEITLTKLPDNKFESAYLKLTAGVSNSPYPYVIGEIVSVPPAEKFKWASGETTKEIYVKADGDYTCKITNKFGCTDEFTFKVKVYKDSIVFSTPAGNIPGSPFVPKKITNNCNYPVFSVKNPLCNPIEFTALVSTKYYQWDFGDKIYSNDKNPTHRFTTSGNHSIDLYFSYDGINWEHCSQTIDVKSIINVNFEYKSLCNGWVDFTDKTSSALGTASKLWEFGDSKSSTAADPSYTYAPATQNFRVKLSVNDGLCTDFIEKDIKVNWLKADFINTGSCIKIPVLFNSTTLHTQTISAISWDFGNGFKEFYAGPSTIYDKAQKYSVKLWVKDVNNCKDSVTKIITISSPYFPKLTVSGSLKLCEGKSIKLTAPKSLSYNWNTFDTTQTIIIKKAGSFFVKLIDKISLCKGNSDTVNVQIIPKPKAILTISNGAAPCENNYLYIDAAYVNNCTYQWYKDNLLLSNINRYLSFYPASLSHTGRYKVLLTDITSGCSDTAVSDIVIFPSPKIPGILVEPSGALCSNQKITLTASNISALDKVQWNTNSINRKISIFGSGYYTLTVFNNYGCPSQISRSVTIEKSPDINAFPTGCYTICENKEIVITLPINFASYKWNDGISGNTRILKQGGVYSVTATAGNCIEKSGNLSLDVIKFNSVLLGKDTCLIPGFTKNLNLSSGNFSSIIWSNGSNGSGIMINKAGKYWVSIKTKEGCLASDTITINNCMGISNVGNPTLNSGVYDFVDAFTAPASTECDKSGYYVPNAFSPNRDGINEYFTIPQNSNSSRLLKLSIYNRWGEIVFQTSKPGEYWDGYEKDRPAHLQAFVYICEYICGDRIYVQKGTINLVK